MASSRPPAPPVAPDSFLTPYLPARPGAQPPESRRLLPHEALAAIQDELPRVPARAIKKVNADVTHIYAIASNAADRVQTFIPQIRLHAPLIPIEPLTKIELYASALIYAQALCMYGTSSIARKLLLEATELRRDLLIASKPLVQEKLLSAGALEQLDRGIGYVNVGADLIILGGIYEGAWKSISEKTTVEKKQVHRAVELGPILAELAAKRERDPIAAEQRDRTFTLLDEAYEIAKSVITFLRRKEKDAKRIVPGLATKAGAGRPKIKRDAKTSDEERKSNGDEHAPRGKRRKSGDDGGDKSGE